MAERATPFRILVVDDNRDILDLVQRVLITFGYDVVIARDGLEAIQQESIMQPDLIVLDVNLPTLDGWEVCRRIKARRSVPVMLLTGKTGRRGVHVAFGVAFGILWAGTFVTGVFFLPH